MNAQFSAVAVHTNFDVLKHNVAQRCFRELEFAARLEWCNQVGRDFDRCGFSGRSFAFGGRRHVTIQIDRIADQLKLVVPGCRSRHGQRAGKRARVELDCEIGQLDGRRGHGCIGPHRHTGQSCRVCGLRRFDIKQVHDTARRKLVDDNCRVHVQVAGVGKRLNIRDDVHIEKTQVERLQRDR